MTDAAKKAKDEAFHAAIRRDSSELGSEIVERAELAVIRRIVQELLGTFKKEDGEVVYWRLVKEQIAR